MQRDYRYNVCVIYIIYNNPVTSAIAIAITMVLRERRRHRCCFLHHHETQNPVTASDSLHPCR